MLLSAVVVAHNEELNLEDCLKSISFADEVVVILDKCTDKSKEIAMKYTSKIFEGSWEIEGERRNFAQSKCAGDFVMEVDADERISEELKDEILREITTAKDINFSAPIENYIGKDRLKNTTIRSLIVTDRQFINFRGGKNYQQDRRLHPVASLQGEVRHLKGKILHYMDKDITSFLARFNRYTSLRSSDIIDSGKTNKKSTASLIGSYLNRFIKSYFVKKGYRDGLLGLVVCLVGCSYNMVSILKSRSQ